MQSTEGQKSKTLKQAVMDAVNRLPDDCSLDEIMYAVEVASRVFEGYNDSEAGQLMSTEVLLERIYKLKK